MEFAIEVLQNPNPQWYFYGNEICKYCYRNEIHKYIFMEIEFVICVKLRDIFKIRKYYWIYITII